MKQRSQFIALILLALFLSSTGLALAVPAGMSPSTSNPGFAPLALVTIPLGQDSVTVDGFCNTDLEYNDALVETFSDYGGSVWL